MLRLEPPGRYRLMQSLPGNIHAGFAGAEFNVAASIVMLGGSARFISALPDNPVGKICRDYIISRGIDASEIVIKPKTRLGIFYSERGANQRPSRIVYDRDFSAIAQSVPGDYDFKSIFKDAEWFHITGITPALSETSAAVAIEALRSAKNAGIRTSIDLNYRAKLWQWRDGVASQLLAREVISEMMPYVDLLIGNESDAGDMLNISSEKNNIVRAIINVEEYEDVARQIVARYPNIRWVATTLRESVSASYNRWGAMLYEVERGRMLLAPLDESGDYRPYEIHAIVDRVGAGDAFAAALIYSMVSKRYKLLADMLRFSAAASCLAHSVEGDENKTDCSEAELLMGGDASGRVQR